MEKKESLRRDLLELLEGKGAHADFEAVFSGVPSEARGRRAAGLPHTLWQLLEHLRIAQRDILEFSRNSAHVSPKWPEGYWPATDAPTEEGNWGRSIAAFKSDLEAMRRLVVDPSTELLARIPHGDGQTIFREALLLADHNAYHLGQVVSVRQALENWRA
ncbi:MAG: DinB family protein [Acidobacteriota bacterium]|nr:DinB family protein [Acidobacteriota bacterium]